MNVCYDASDRRSLTGAYVGDTILFVHDQRNFSLKEVNYYTYRVLCNQCLINFQTTISINNNSKKSFKTPLSDNDILYISQNYPSVFTTYRIGNHRWKTGNKSLIQDPETQEFFAGKDYSLVIKQAPALEFVSKTMLCFFIFFFLAYIF